jgi:hypothetical protein
LADNIDDVVVKVKNFSQSISIVARGTTAIGQVVSSTEIRYRDTNSVGIKDEELRAFSTDTILKCLATNIRNSFTRSNLTVTIVKNKSTVARSTGSISIMSGTEG